MIKKIVSTLLLVASAHWLVAVTIKSVKFTGASPVKVAAGQYRLTDGTMRFLKSPNECLEGINVFKSNDSKLVLVSEDGEVGTLDGLFEIYPNTNKIKITGSTTMNGALEGVSLVLSGVTAKVSGAVTKYSRNTIRLDDANTVLALGVSAPVSTNIVLAGGKISLTSDLKLSTSGANLVGDGGIIFNGRSLIFDASPRTLGNILLMQNAADWTFNGKVTVTGELIFDGDSNIIGNGNILDLSQGGTIRIKDNTSVYMSDLEIRGLGLGKIVFDDVTSQIKLANVDFQFNRDYTFTTGGIYVEGPTNFITGDKIFTISTRASMTVDGIGMTYDTLTFTDKKNIRPTRTADPSQNFIAYLNNGTIHNLSNLDLASSNSNAIVWIDTQLQTIDHGPNNVVINTSTYTMAYDVYLSLDHLMLIESDTVIDGNGHSIYFASDSPNILQIASNVNVTFKNVVFRNYVDSAVQIGTGSTVLFDDQTVLVLGQSQQMLYTWNFTGNCFIHGHGNLLTIYPSNSIVVAPHSRLTIHDTSLDGLYLNNIRCAGPTATVAFQDCGLLLDNNVSFTTGAMEFGSDVYIRGTNSFSYESESALTVTSNSRLVMDGITFRYAPSVANRDLFTLFDRSAQLAIDGITLASTTTGMRLTRGTLIVDHINNLVNESATSLSEGFALGNGNIDDDLDIQFKPGGSLNVISGMIDYQNVDVNIA